MRTLRLLPCFLALGCSEYGFNSGSDPDSDDSAMPPTVTPADPSDPGEDTGDPRNGGDPDCDRNANPVFRELPLPHDPDRESAFMPTDFDDSGLMLAVSPLLHPGDLFGVTHDGTRLPLVQDLPMQPYMPRMLSDGRMIWISHTETQYGLSVFDPVQGSEVAYHDMEAIRQYEPTTDRTVYAAVNYGGGDESQIIHLDPYSGKFARVAGPSRDLQFVQDIAVSPRGTRVYYTVREGVGLNDLKESVYGIARYGPNDWGPPIHIWTAPDLSIVGMKLAVDMCDNLYITHEQDLWFVPWHGSMSERAAQLGFPVYVKDLYWGSGAGDAKKDALYVLGFEHGTSRLTRFELDLDVDGTHILAR